MPKNLTRDSRGVIVENKPLVIDSVTVGSVTVSGGTINITTADAIVPAFGEVAGTALTGSFQNLLVPGGDAKLVLLVNDCDQDIIISFDAGTTENIKLDSNVSTALDLAMNGMVLNNLTYQVKHAGVVPTAGSIKCTIFRTA